MKHKVTCHCGKVALEVEGDIPEVLSCNCSICQRKGSLLWFLPASAVRLTTPRTALSTYTFNKHHIQHHFCATCGCAPFGEGKDPQGNSLFAINVRCVDGLDLTTLKVQHFDGRSL